jgi:HAD superfamily hydrolase (TIGR01509 family)
MVRFDPGYIVGQTVSDAADAALLTEVVFDRAYWDRLDAGTITDGEVLQACRTRLPERLWGAAETVYFSWIHHIPAVAGMPELVRELRARGDVRLYLLSNISNYFADHAEELPVLKLFDRCVFSAVCGKVKPDPAIFAHLCEECDLLPQESLFVDDNPANVAGAEAFGIAGYLFDGDVARLRAYLDMVLEDD